MEHVLALAKSMAANCPEDAHPEDQTALKLTFFVQKQRRKTDELTGLVRMLEAEVEYL